MMSNDFQPTPPPANAFSAMLFCIGMGALGSLLPMLGAAAWYALDSSGEGGVSTAPFVVGLFVSMFTAPLALGIAVTLVIVRHSRRMRQWRAEHSQPPR